MALGTRDMKRRDARPRQLPEMQPSLENNRLYYSMRHAEAERRANVQTKNALRFLEFYFVFFVYF